MKASTKILLRDGSVRAIRTFAEATLASLGVTLVTVTELPTWSKLLTALSTGVIAGIISILWSLKGLPESETEVAQAKAAQVLEDANTKLEAAKQYYEEEKQVSNDTIYEGTQEEIEISKSIADEQLQSAKQAVDEAKKEVESAQQALDDLQA